MDIPPCQNVYTTVNEGDRSVIISLPTPSFPEGITLQLIYPTAPGLLPDGAPAVVVVHGGMASDVVPVQANERVLLNGRGLVQIYLNLPGGDGPWSTAGSGDARGARSRAALADALTYALGDTPDMDGCTLADRIPLPLSDTPPVLYGHSNGGNLALALLADEDMPVSISGLVTFETPASAQFTTVEVGSVGHPLPQYLGECQWHGTDGLRCEMAYDALAWCPQQGDDSAFDGAFFDQDGDGKYHAGLDYPVWGLRLGETQGDRIIYSPQLAAAVERANFPAMDMMDSDTSWAFWEERDGSRLATGAARAYPDLRTIIIGTEQDHILGAPDHAHISGLAAALQKAGADWVRINPDSAYVDSLLEMPVTFCDNAANQGFFPGDPKAEMEPDEDLDIDARFYSTAAAVEILERSALNRWERDLSERLWP